MDKFSSVNQYATAAVKTQTPLWDKAPIEGASVALKELPLMGHFNLRINPDNSAAMQAASKVLGMDLPGAVLTSIEQDGTRISWVSPDEWYVLMPRDQAAGFEIAFREALADHHYSIVDVSAGQTALELSGVSARSVLMKGAAVDVHDSAFPVGKVVGTAIAKSSGMIVRDGENSYLLLIRRSFANYLWDWLSDACQEYTGAHRRI